MSSDFFDGLKTAPHLPYMHSGFKTGWPIIYERNLALWKGLERDRPIATIDVLHESLTVQRPNSWCYGVLIWDS